MEANYREGELVNLTGKEDEGDLTASYRRWWETLPAIERRTVRCVTSHTAQYLIPVVTDRPVRAFCTLRDPVERVISLLFFVRWMDEHGKPSRMLATMRERGWELKHVYRELAGAGELPAEERELFWPLFNGQAREIAGPSIDWSSHPFEAGTAALRPLRDRASDILIERYVVGVSERFSQSLRLFADAFGWRHTFLAEVNVRPYGFLRSEIDEETRSLVRAYNSVDAELHDRYMRAVSTLPHVRRRDDLSFRARRRTRRGLVDGRRKATEFLRGACRRVG